MSDKEKTEALLKDITGLNNKIQNLQMEEHRQEGVREQLLKDLKDQFDVSTKKEAEEMLVALQSGLIEEEKELGRIVESLQKVVDSNV